MGEFILPGLGVFLIGTLLVLLVGWLLRERKPDTPRNARHDLDPNWYWDGYRWWQWHHGAWHPLSEDGTRDGSKPS